MRKAPRIGDRRGLQQDDRAARTPRRGAYFVTALMSCVSCLWISLASAFSFFSWARASALQARSTAPSAFTLQSALFRSWLASAMFLRALYSALDWVFRSLASACVTPGAGTIFVSTVSVVTVVVVVVVPGVPGAGCASWAWAPMLKPAAAAVTSSVARDLFIVYSRSLKRPGYRGNRGARSSRAVAQREQGARGAAEIRPAGGALAPGGGKPPPGAPPPPP